MFYICVALGLAIVYLSKLYLNEKLKSENDKYLYNKEIESLEKAYNELAELISCIDTQSQDTRNKYFKIKNTGEAMDKWYRKFENGEQLKKWRNSMLISHNKRKVETLKQELNKLKQ